LQLFIFKYETVFFSTKEVSMPDNKTKNTNQTGTDTPPPRRRNRLVMPAATEDGTAKPAPAVPIPEHLSALLQKLEKREQEKALEEKTKRAWAMMAAISATGGKLRKDISFCPAGWKKTMKRDWSPDMLQFMINGEIRAHNSLSYESINDGCGNFLRPEHHAEIIEAFLAAEPFKETDFNFNTPEV